MPFTQPLNAAGQWIRNSYYVTLRHWRDLGNRTGWYAHLRRRSGGYISNGRKPHFSPFFVPKLISNMASGMISLKFGLMGINYTTVSACATSNTAIMDAYNYIRLGKAKAIISGGSESPRLSHPLVGFNAMRAMSTNNDHPKEASRPFDEDREGFVMGENAGALSTGRV